MPKARTSRYLNSFVYLRLLPVSTVPDSESRHSENALSVFAFLFSSFLQSFVCVMHQQVAEIVISPRGINKALLCCIVLCCIVLCCVVLYCVVLYCVVLHCVVLHCVVLYCVVLYCVVL